LYRGYIDKNHKIELVSSFDHINSDLIFLVAKDENDERLKAALNAAKEALAIKDSDLKNSKYQNDKSCSYTYMYFKDPSLPSLKSIFYVGKGKGTRWTQHVSDQLNKDISLVTNKKELLINDWIKGQHNENEFSSKSIVNKSKNLLVRKIGQWCDQYSEASAFTMEHVLISGLIGVFDLANGNGGQSTYKSLNLLVKPAKLDTTIPANSKLWNKAIKKFETNNHSSLIPFLYLCSAKKIVDEITKKLFSLNLIPYPIPYGRKEIDHMPSHCAVVGAGDQSLYFRTKNEHPFCLQLKLSKKEAGFKINLKPLQRTLNGFKDFKFFLNEVSNQKNQNSNFKIKFQIKKEGGDAYFKPFAPDGKGRKDPVFPIDDTEVSVQPNWLPSHLKLNLTTALKHLNDNFN